MPTWLQGAVYLRGGVRVARRQRLAREMSPPVGDTVARLDDDSWEAEALRDMKSDYGRRIDTLRAEIEEPRRKMADLCAENERLRPDAERGALVRRMPEECSLFHGTGRRHPPLWQCYKPTSVSCDSPEAALRAALGA